MVAPVLLGLQGAGGGGHDQADLAMVADLPLTAGAAGLLLHVGAMLLVMGVVAVVVFERVGLGVLRRAWINTDQLWAGSFVVAGVVTLLS
jgi:hypothetical protein